MVKNQFKENAMSETKRRAKYTLEFKLEAVRLVKGGQVAFRDGKEVLSR